MTIDKFQIQELIANALPSFLASDDFHQWLQFRSDESVNEHAYCILAHHLISHIVENFDLLSAAQSLQSIFALVEKLHVDGDIYVKQGAMVGFLEDLQNSIRHKGLESDLFPRCEKYLGPESSFWWQELILFWSAKIPYLGASR